MTHEEIVTLLMIGNYRAKDLVEITLTNGQTVVGKLSDAIAYYDEGENGEKINSRIGLLPPPPPPGYLVGQPNVPTPVYTHTITDIKKVQLP